MTPTGSRTSGRRGGRHERRDPLRRPRGRPPRRPDGAARPVRRRSSCCGSTSTATRRSTRRTSSRPSTCTNRPRGYLSTPDERPVFFDHGHYIHITTYAPRRGAGRRAARGRVRRRQELGRHRPRPADPRARGVRRPGLRLGRNRHAGRAQLPGRPARVGARGLLRRVRAHGAAARGVRRPGHARRRLGRGHRDARLDAPGGGEAAPCPGFAPLRPGGVDPPGARAARQRPVLRAVRVALQPLRGHGAGGAGCPGGHRRLLRRPHRTWRPPHQ